MAVPNSRRLVVEGTMSGNERFAFSWAALGPVVVGQGAQAWTDAIKANAAFTAFITALKPFMNTGTSATTLRGYYYDNQGNLADAGVSDITSGVGTGGNPTPNQCALVASLRTASNTRSGRGRMYLPCNGVGAAAASGKLNISVTALTAAIASLMGYTLGQVASETQGQLRPVTVVKVGDVVDTIRARRSRLQEIYTQAAVS